MFDVIVKKATHLVEDNSTTILTGIGVAGTITATVLSGRAGFRAAQILDEEIRKNVDSALAELKSIDEPLNQEEMSTKEKIWLVGPQFIPVVGTTVVAVAAIIFANRLSAKETAAMAAMYGLSDKTFQEYKEKVQEKLGQNKETALRDEIAQDRVNRNPPDDRTIIITGGGDVLCYDTVTDRYFNSTVENIKRAENEVNGEIAIHDAVPMSRFYDHLGMKATPYTEEVGWTIENRCEVQFSTVMSPDQKPCISIDFARYPKSDFDKIWP